MKLPARFDHDRILLHPVTTDGVELKFYTDSGGAAPCILRSTVDRLGLTPFRRRLGDEEFEFVYPPTCKEDATLPMGGGFDALIVADDVFGNIFGGGDGFLGMQWFADRVWRFDYPNKGLFLLDANEPGAEGDEHACSLGFPHAPDGRRLASFPRISADVDGVRLEFLFDTGAQVTLTSHARACVPPADAGVRRGTSFITHTVFMGWRDRHPDWTVIEKADAGCMEEPMIQVPAVQIAGYNVGPVWFVRRADREFHDGMSQWMDQRIDGALGGSVLKYFTVTVDYPKAVAYFRR
jgi:hypothetical protein